MADLRKQTVPTPTPVGEVKKVLSLKEQRDRDAQPVRGIFRFHEVPGGCMQFSFKKYKENKVRTYTLMDGKIEEVPFEVATHLNKNLWYPQYSYEKIEGMQEVQKVGKKIRRCSFQSLEFIDDADLRPDGIAAMTIEVTAPLNND